MISEKDLNNVPLEADRRRNIPTNQSSSQPYLENDSYDAWWYRVTSGWPPEARAEETPTVVSEEGRLYVVGADGQVTRALESDLRKLAEPLAPPAVIRPRFKRTSDGYLGAVRD
jgi:hypothetical protein